MINIWRIATAMVRRTSYNYDIRYDIPYALGLSGTPLNESLIALIQSYSVSKREWCGESTMCYSN